MRPLSSGPTWPKLVSRNTARFFRTRCSSGRGEQTSLSRTSKTPATVVSPIRYFAPDKNAISLPRTVDPE